MGVDTELPHGQTTVHLPDAAQVADPNLSWLTENLGKIDNMVFPQNAVAGGAVEVATRHTPLGDVVGLVEVQHLLREDDVEGLHAVIDET